MLPSLFAAVVKNNVEAAGHRDKKLMAGFQGMPGTIGAAWYIVEVKNAFDCKRNVFVTLNKRQIASRIGHLWKVDYFAVIN